ncbi:MAG: RNA polymerase sigma factor [Melioribacteraceae bacterium]
MSETELIESCKSGDGEAFRKLMHTSRQQLFGYLWRMGGSQYAAEEMFQETLIKVWKGIKNYNYENKFTSWLFSIAHNTAIDHIRKNKRKSNEVEIIESDLQVYADAPDEIIIKNEKFSRIEKAVHKLNEKQKEVFILRQHSGMKFK